MICPRIILELTVVILRSEIRVSVLEPDVSDLTTADTDVLAVGGCADLNPRAQFACTSGLSTKLKPWLSH